jgi:hypothetical protein
MGRMLVAHTGLHRGRAARASAPRAKRFRQFVRLQTGSHASMACSAVVGARLRANGVRPSVADDYSGGE